MKMNMKKMFSSIDTHTERGPTRVITSGNPRLYGQTMSEKNEFFSNYKEEIKWGKSYPLFFVSS